MFLTLKIVLPSISVIPRVRVNPKTFAKARSDGFPHKPCSAIYRSNDSTAVIDGRYLFILVENCHNYSS
jgi:hypothetical protein